MSNLVKYQAGLLTQPLHRQAEIERLTHLALAETVNLSTGALVEVRRTLNEAAQLRPGTLTPAQQRAWEEATLEYIASIEELRLTSVYRIQQILREIVRLPA